VLDMYAALFSRCLAFAPLGISDSGDFWPLSAVLQRKILELL
jgi:hypothetical protein